MSVLDIGSGMGFFSLPLAKLVGEKGRVVCIDLQEKMIKVLSRGRRRRGWPKELTRGYAAKARLGVSDLAGKIDFALAFALVHEVPDKERLFGEIHDAMKLSGKLLMAEPKGHVSKPDFERTVSLAQGCGFEVTSDLKIRRSHAALLRAIPPGAN